MLYLLKKQKQMVSIQEEFIMTNTLTVVYGDTTLEVPANTDINALKVAMAENFPELKSADVSVNGSEVKFTAKAGTKGATNMENLTVIYGDTTLEVPAGTDLTALKAAMAENFPELKNADVVTNGNEVRFSAKAGTKGADNVETLTVIYGDTTLEVPGNTDLTALKAAMAENFPELKNADVTTNGNEVRFSAKAGTKGAGDNLTVIYGDTTLEVPAGTDITALKAAMAENFPELKNADVVTSGNEIRFSAKAGTKGADELTVIYGDTTLQVPAGTDITALKAAMAENFPELKNADVVTSGNEIRFSAKAGTKGI